MLVVGQNSWVTVIEADEYLEDRIGSEDWFIFPDDANPGVKSKGSLLVSAFRWLIGCGQFNLIPTLTDDFVKNAQIEAALFLSEHYNELNERRAAISTGIKEFSMGRKRETFDPNQFKIPDHIAGMLQQYMEGNTTATLLGEYDA